MKQTIEIEVPDGKKAVWKDGAIVFEDIKSKLPKTWEEFCKQNKVVKKDECYLNNCCYIISAQKDVIGYERRKNFDRNILPNKQAAEQHLVLMQLHQLRDCYRQGWIPTVDEVLFGIIRRVNGRLEVNSFTYSLRFLSFQSEEIAKEFLDNFRDLIEQAGDLV